MKPLYTTITTPAADHSLVTLADLREQLRIKPNDTANDAWLTKVIVRTSRQCERFCNRVFVVQTYQDNFLANTSADIGQPLILSQAPVNPASFSVSIDGQTLVSGTDYGLDQFAGLVYRTGTVWTSTTSLAAAYAAGFLPIPDDVQQAVFELCTVENSGRGRDPMLRASESPGLGRQEYWVGGLPSGTTIPEYIAGRLYPYRRGLVA